MKKVVINVVRYSLLFIIFFFIFKFLYRNVEELKSYEFHLNFSFLVISILFFLLYLFGKSLIWHFITLKNGVNIHLSKSIVSWSYSMLGKYIPGKMFFLLGRIYFYKQEGKSSNKVTFCFFLENICSILGAFSIFLFSLNFLDVEILRGYKFIVWILLFGLFVLAHPRVLQFLINSGRKIFKKQAITLRVSYPHILSFVALYTLNWFLLGFGFYFFIRSIVEISIQHYFFLTGSYAIAGLIGIISLFAPSGIGVRESVLVFTLKNILSNSIAAICVLTARIWSTISELLFVGIVFLYAKLKRIDFRNVTQAEGDSENLMDAVPEKAP